jgi:hypothetical protein
LSSFLSAIKNKSFWKNHQISLSKGIDKKK